MKKIVIIISGIAVSGILLKIFYDKGMGNTISMFLNEYMNYINGDIENRAKLFESIFGGICSGGVTFGALFITILHENKKDREFWER